MHYPRIWKIIEMLQLRFLERHGIDTLGNRMTEISPEMSP